MILAAALIALAAAAARAEEAVDLTGLWMGEGYACYDAFGRLTAHAERVEIFVEDDALVAVKLDGDPCVGAGEVTWRAQVPGDSFDVGVVIPVTSHTRAPGHVSVWVSGAVEVAAPDRLVWRVAPTIDPFPVIFRRYAEPVS